MVSYEEAFKNLKLQEKILFFFGIFFYFSPLGWIVFLFVFLHARDVGADPMKWRRAARSCRRTSSTSKRKP